MKVVSSRKKVSGLTLVELMVSLVIGLVVVGAVILQYLGTGTSSRQQSAASQLTEDAQIALSILTRELQLAGYSQPVGLSPVTITSPVAAFVRTVASAPIYGCTGGSATKAVGMGHACQAGLVSSSFEVNYEADTSDAITTSSNVPTSCIGTALVATPVTVTTGTGTTSLSVYPSSNWFFITATAALGIPELHCQGPTGGSHPLVENVETMTVLYGQADPDLADSRTAVRYLSAADIGTTDAAWNKVVSVRLCIRMRSAFPVRTNEDVASFLDCDYTTKTLSPDDRRLRRAFFTTVAIRNRTAF